MVWSENEEGHVVVLVVAILDLSGCVEEKDAAVDPVREEATMLDYRDVVLGLPGDAQCMIEDQNVAQEHRQQDVERTCSHPER
jgi:hypothetical protein